MTIVIPTAARPLVLACVLAGAISAASAVSLNERKDVALPLTAIGTVTAIDPAARTITVKGERGEFTYQLDRKVRNVEQLKPGDRVKVDYVAALALRLRRGGEAMRQKMEAEAAARRQAGDAPYIPRGTTIVTEVLAVDMRAQTVRLKGPMGRASEFRVQDKADLVGVRVGDQVVAVVHDAVAVGVVPAAK